MLFILNRELLTLLSIAYRDYAYIFAKLKATPASEYKTQTLLLNEMPAQNNFQLIYLNKIAMLLNLLAVY